MKPKATKNWTARTIPELAAALNLSERIVSSYLARGAPRAKNGYSIPAFVTWLRETIWKPKPLKADDAMMSGPASPMLEKWREERFLMARIERMERIKMLIRREAVHDFYGLLAGHIRALGEEMQRAGIHDGYQMLTEMLDNLEAEGERFFNKYPPAEFDSAEDEHEGN